MMPATAPTHLPLPLRLAVSGELPGRALLARFDGVGLVRSEYVFRDLQLYPTEPRARAALGVYLTRLCERASGTVVYRTMEVTEAEAAVLAGAPTPCGIARDDLLGRRGIRLHQADPAGLDAELATLASVARHHANLALLAPFVTTAGEYAWFQDRVSRVAPSVADVGTMLETPAAAIDVEDFIAAGCRRFLVGANDLTSLLAARPRGPSSREGRQPGLERLLRYVADRVHRVGGTVGIAGYLTRDLLEVAHRAGLDHAVVHYCDLPRLLGWDPADLPELGHVERVKRRTRAAIADLRRS